MIYDLKLLILVSILSLNPFTKFVVKLREKRLSILNEI